MRPYRQFVFVLMGLLLGACSGLRQPAPVEDRTYRPPPELGTRDVSEASGHAQGPASPVAAGGRPASGKQRQSAVPQQEPEPEPVTRARRPGKIPGKPPQASSAALALLQDADGYARAGDADRAASALERAIRIEPGNPWLWHRFAVLRLQQHNWGQALELAGKSNALGGDDIRLQAGNWHVIAAAHEGAGNHPAALKARLHAEELEQGLGR